MLNQEQQQTSKKQQSNSGSNQATTDLFNQYQNASLPNQHEKELQIESKVFNLSIHSASHQLEDSHEILLSQEIFEEYFSFENFQNQDAFILIKYNDAQNKRQTIILKVCAKQIKQQRNEISILKDICEVHGLVENQQVLIYKFNPLAHFEGIHKTSSKQQIGPENDMGTHIIDQVEITFKDQFVSRRDMWKIAKDLHNVTLYKNKKLEINGIRFIPRALFKSRNSKPILNGIVNLEKTKFLFFSKSSQIQILIEASKDLYGFDHNGHLQIEKLVVFLRTFFDRCIKQYSASHEVNIVVYSRLFHPQIKNQNELKEALKALEQQNLSEIRGSSSFWSQNANQIGAFFQSKHQRFFQDAYIKIGVFEITKSNSEKCISAVKRTLNYFPSLVNWSINCPDHVQKMKQVYSYSEYSKIQGNDQQNNQFIGCHIDIAEKQNILEAINLSLFNLNNENFDQNLKKTGHQLIILSAGTGVYKVNADMINPTKSRALHGGTPIQIVSFSTRPQFQTPLFQRCCTYKNPFETQNELHTLQIKAKQQREQEKQRTARLTETFPSGLTLQHPVAENFNQQYQNDSFQQQNHLDQFNVLEHNYQDLNETVDHHHKKSDLQQLFFVSWINIVYLFDMKLLESNFQLRALNSGDQSSPIDALNTIDKNQSLDSQNNPNTLKFVPQKNFSFLRDAKTKIDNQAKKFSNLKKAAQKQIEVINDTRNLEMNVAYRHRSNQNYVQQSDYVLHVTTPNQMIHHKMKIQNEQINKIMFQHDLKASGMKSKPILNHQNSERLVTQNIDASKMIGFGSQNMVLKPKGPKSQLFNLNMPLDSKHRSPFTGHLKSNASNVQSLHTQKHIQSIEEEDHAVMQSMEMPNSGLRNIDSFSSELHSQHVGSQFVQRQFDQSPMSNNFAAQKNKQIEWEQVDQTQEPKKEHKLMKMIKTVNKEHEDDLEYASINDDNEVSKVIDETSSMDKNTEHLKSPMPTLGLLQIQALRAGDSQSKDLCSPSFYELDQNQKDYRKRFQSDFNNTNLKRSEIKQKPKLGTISNREGEIKIFKQDLQEKMKEYVGLKFELDEQRVNIDLRSKSNLKYKINQSQQNQTFFMNQGQHHQPHGQKLEEQTPNKRRWSHSFTSIKHLQHQFYKNQQILNLLSKKLDKQVIAETIEHMFSNFWKNICECKLLPITIDVYPDKSDILNPKEYHKNESKFIYKPTNNITLVRNDAKFVEELLCLKLTQNFQFFSQNALCMFDDVKFDKSKVMLQMGIGHMHHQLEKHEFEKQIFFEAFVKQNQDIGVEMSAKFKYMLFSFYENRFKMKTSQENRLFSFRQLQNMEEAIEDFSQLRDLLIKVPQIDYVLIPSKKCDVEEIAKNFSKFKQDFLASTSFQNKGSSTKLNNFLKKRIKFEDIQVDEEQISSDFELKDDQADQDQFEILQMLLNQGSLNSGFNHVLSEQHQLKSSIFYELPENRQKYQNQIKNALLNQFKHPTHKQEIAEISGGYLLECDKQYKPSLSPCFSFKISWIFATCVQIQDSIKGIQRRAKDNNFETIPISSLPMGSTDLNPFEIETVLRLPSQVSSKMDFINHTIAHVTEMNEALKDNSPDQIPLTLAQGQLQIDCLKDESLIGIQNLESTPQFKRTTRIFSENLQSQKIIEPTVDDVKAQGLIDIQIKNKQISINEIEREESSDNLQKEKKIKSDVMEYKEDKNKNLKSLDQMEKKQQAISASYNTNSKSNPLSNRDTVVNTKFSQFPLNRIFQITNILEQMLEGYSQQLVSFTLNQNLGQDLNTLKDINQKLKFEKLFNWYFTECIQRRLDFVLYKNQLANLSKEESIGHKKNQCSMNESCVITHFIHKSGICLLSLNQLSNEIIWIDNDVVSNNVKGVASLDIDKNPSIQSEPNVEHINGIVPVERDAFNVGNNDYSVSNLLQSKVCAVIVSLEILVEIINDKVLKQN